MSFSSLSCPLTFYAIIFALLLLISFDNFKELCSCGSHNFVQPWASTTTPNQYAQHPIRMDQVGLEHRSEKQIDDTDFYLQLYRTSLAA